MIKIICLKIIECEPSFILFYVFTMCYISSGYCIKYHNYTLYRGIPVTEEQLMFYYEMGNFYDVDYWKEPGSLFKPVDFTINPKDRGDFLRETKKKNLQITTVIDDVQKEFDKQIVTSYVRRKLGSYNWTGYYGLNDIYKWLTDLQKQYPQEMTLKNIGKTHDGRPIKYVRVNLKGANGRSNVIVEGGIHPREWISPAFVTYMLNEILKAPLSSNKELKTIALTYIWNFVPVLNPDGYEYTHTTNRMWRKNRSKPSGVDLNRNFDFKFATVGVSHDQYSSTYCGPKAFSEKETQSMANLIKATGDTLEYYLSFHSYGQDMILPYTNTQERLDNYNQVSVMAKEAATKIAQKYQTRYSVGTAYELLGYRTSGVSGCWTKYNFRVPYVLTIELRDHGHYGFALPPNYIIPTCEEMMDGLISFLKPKTTTFEKLKTDPPKQLSRPRNKNVSNRNMISSYTIIYNFVILFIICDFK